MPVGSAHSVGPFESADDSTSEELPLPRRSDPNEPACSNVGWTGAGAEIAPHLEYDGVNWVYGYGLVGGGGLIGTVVGGGGGYGWVTPDTW